MVVWRCWVSRPVDIILVDITAVKPKCEISIVHHIAPRGTNGVLPPQFDVIQPPIYPQPISILNVCLENEVVDVVI